MKGHLDDFRIHGEESVFAEYIIVGLRLAALDQRPQRVDLFDLCIRRVKKICLNSV